MASQGWISVHRKIEDDWLWKDKPFSKGQAWVDLLLMVNHEDNKILFNGELIEVKRGQRITSIKKLCDRWGWSNKKVKRFLELLQEDDKIGLEIAPRKATTITIVNYSLYQDEAPAKASRKHQRSITEAPQRHINNNDNNDNNDNKDDDIEKRLKKINGLVNKKVSSSQIKKFLKSNSLDDLDKLIGKIKESEWLKENIDFNKLSEKFIKRVFDDDFITYKTNKNTFKNFEQITDNYSSDELEEMAMRKQREAFERLGIKIWVKIYLVKSSLKRKYRI